MKSETTAPRQSISRLLMLLGFAVGVACLMVLLVIYLYGVIGPGPAGNLLIDPQVLSKLTKESTYLRGTKDVAFAFDRIELSKPLSHGHGGVVQEVAFSDYADIFELLKSDSPIVDPQETVLTVFSDPRQMRLSIWVRPGGTREARPFLEMTFPPEGNVYRIELLDPQAVDERVAYYYHPDVHKKVASILGVDY